MSNIVFKAPDQLLQIGYFYSVYKLCVYERLLSSRHVHFSKGFDVKLKNKLKFFRICDPLLSRFSSYFSDSSQLVKYKNIILFNKLYWCATRFTFSTYSITYMYH